MADYYSLIARAVAGLPDNNSKARHGLELRAGGAFAARLPCSALNETEIVAHRLSLEHEVRTVHNETELEFSITTERRRRIRHRNSAHWEAPASKARGHRLPSVLTARKHGMADYYSLIARAVAGLPDNNSKARH